jgi:2-polyprenyl-6-methoxyphenol hydroxylase-like FAD-dependent oxidoreductase
LAAALGLASKGCRVTVLEQADRFAEICAGIDRLPFEIELDDVVDGHGTRRHISGEQKTIMVNMVMDARVHERIDNIPISQFILHSDESDWLRKRD